MNSEELKKRAEELKPWLIDVRRDFHRNPELGGAEQRTSARIKEFLDGMGIPYTTPGGSTAVCGLIRGGHEGKTVGIRADMDALPIKENNNLEFRSRRDGVMHACGHDAHTTILLGTAKLLNEVKDRLHGNVKLFFQPAEETDGGAEKMVRDGCMENPHVDYCFGLHVMPHLKTGQIEIKYGALNGASNPFTITVHGKSAHGAYPDLGRDAVVIASQVVTALQTLISRQIAPVDSAVCTVGSIHGGTKGNIIADTVEMTGILRTLSPETREFCVRRVGEIARGVSEALGGSADVNVQYGYEALINSDDMVDIVKSCGTEALGGENIVLRRFPSLGVEDFSYFLDRCPGAFFHLGCTAPDSDKAEPLHTPGFMLDENCLPIGVLMHSSIVFKLIGGQE